MLNLRSTLFVISLGLVASQSLAHGPQIQITNDGGQIVTRELILDGPYGDALTDAKSVYVIPMLPSGPTYFSRPNTEEAAPGIPAFNSGPGIAYGINSTFNWGFHFELSFVDGLKIWNGAGFVDPGMEQIEAYRGSAAAPSASAITTDAGPFAGIAFSTITENYSAESHGSASYRLLGDGVSPTAAGDDGVYLLSLQLSSDDPSLESSDPFYFILHKNVGLTEALAAARSLGVDSARIQVVPEAGSLTLAGLALLALGGCVVRGRNRA